MTTRRSTDLSNQSATTHTLVQALIRRFGSRRALIEELDRRKRLSLLYPAPAEVKRSSPKVKNEPNPEWRAISTPNLLIPGETAVDFIKTVNPELSDLFLEEISQNPTVLPKSTKKFPKTRQKRQIDEISGEIPKSGKFCKGCGIDHNDYTLDCDRCYRRHRERFFTAMKRESERAKHHKT